jgi:hypothetical protein
MKEFFKQLLTGKDNITYDIGRVTWLGGFVTIIGLAAYEVSTATISLRELAEALGIVSGAGGASVMLKRDSEPEGKT